MVRAGKQYQDTLISDTVGRVMTVLCTGTRCDVNGVQLAIGFGILFIFLSAVLSGAHIFFFF